MEFSPSRRPILWAEMDPHTGQIYDETDWKALSEAKKAELVRIEGPEPAIMYISKVLKAEHKKKRKAAKKARRKGRK